MRFSYKILYSIFSKALILFFVAGCSNLQSEKPSADLDINPTLEQEISAFTGKPVGTNILELGQKKTGPGTMPVNALLWRAALDIASFVPLDDVDTFGGSIVTEWYVPEDQTNRRLKLAVFVVGLELRSDAVQVRAYVQNREGDGWANVGRDANLSRKLENLILTRAREMRNAVVSETSN
jgi:hypothetical protein